MLLREGVVLSGFTGNPISGAAVRSLGGGAKSVGSSSDTGQWSLEWAAGTADVEGAMIRFRHFLFLTGLVLAVGSLLVGIGFVVLPARFAGAESRSGSVGYVLEPAEYWRYTRTLETQILLTDARGITLLASAPVVGVVLLDPETGRTSDHAVDVSPDLIHQDTLVWNVSLRIPEGRQYCGAYLEEGSYEDMSGRMHAIGWSIAAWDSD